MSFRSTFPRESFRSFLWFSLMFLDLNMNEEMICYVVSDKNINSSNTCINTYEDNMLRSTYVSVIMSCLFGGPRNSSFMLCSSRQITSAVNRKNNRTVIHRIEEKGPRNAHGLLFPLALRGTRTTSPDSVNGWVKSTIRRRSASIAISPTSASYSC